MHRRVVRAHELEASFGQLMFGCVSDRVWVGHRVIWSVRDVLVCSFVDLAQFLLFKPLLRRFA